MSNNLKRSLSEKVGETASPDFDSRFFEKLEKQKQQKRPGVFSNWITWAISGCATASVLFIAINTYKVPNATFNHKEYVEAAMEIQSTMDESITGDMSADLTSSAVDEI